MEKKFEIGKIYAYKKGCGTGYDKCVWNVHYLITRKSEKSVWWKKVIVIEELYGKDINEKLDFKDFENKDEKRSKLRLYKNVYEYEESFNDKDDTVFFDFVKEVK